MLPHIFHFSHRHISDSGVHHLHTIFALLLRLEDKGVRKPGRAIFPTAGGELEFRLVLCVVCDDCCACDCACCVSHVGCFCCAVLCWAPPVCALGCRVRRYMPLCLAWSFVKCAVCCGFINCPFVVSCLRVCSKAFSLVASLPSHAQNATEGCPNMNRLASKVQASLSQELTKVGLVGIELC